MKTLPNFALFLSCASRVAAGPVRQLCGEWQEGLETRSGYTQRKLRLTLTPLAAGFGSWLTDNDCNEHTMDSGDGNGHLPLWWIRR